MRPGTAVASHAPLRRRGLLAGVLAIALLLPGLQQAAQQHAFSHTPQDRSLFGAQERSAEPGSRSDGCATCVALGALLACLPIAVALPAALLTAVDDPFVATVLLPAATDRQALRNRGPPATA